MLLIMSCTRGGNADVAYNELDEGRKLMMLLIINWTRGRNS